MTLWQKVAGAAMSATGLGPLIGSLRRLARDASSGGGDASADVRFTIALIALYAKMARSDGRVTSEEIEAFDRLIHVPDEERGNVRRLFDLAKREVAGFEEYARQIGTLFEGQPQLLRDVVEGLYVIAAADGVLHPGEEAFLRAAAVNLGVPPSEIDHVRSLFVAHAGGPYEVLGISPGASDGEVKAHYRALVRDNHPDKLVGRGVPAEFVLIAERKLAAINAAYDVIARERGL